MGFVDNLRNEIIMVRNITAFLEKEEEKQLLKKERMMKNKINVSVQTSN
jgi:hypothetical protein